MWFGMESRVITAIRGLCPILACRVLARWSGLGVSAVESKPQKGRCGPQLSMRWSAEAYHGYGIASLPPLGLQQERYCYISMGTIGAHGSLYDASQPYQGDPAESVQLQGRCDHGYRSLPSPLMGPWPRPASVGARPRPARRGQEGSCCLKTMGSALGEPDLIDSTVISLGILFYF